jgi:DNA (cytosine-5)-methyltransferase 1
LEKRIFDVDIPGRINGISLFSGIGGIDLALREWVRPIAYCEIDPYCQGVLLSRIFSGDLPEAPIWENIKTLCLQSFDSTIDILYGGFPCQDISVAGLGKGLEGERSGLFFEIVRLAKEIKPTFLFLENVPAITTRGGLEVVRTIAEMGYDCRWCVISAASVGALHKRERWFLLAYAKHNGSSASPRGGSVGTISLSGEQYEQTESFGKVERAGGLSSHVAYTNRKGCNKEQRRQPIGLQEENAKSTNSDPENGCDTMCKSGEQAYQGTESEQEEEGARRRSSGEYWPFESREHWKETVSSMGKCTDGLSNLVDRLRSLGNAVVPQQTKEAFEILMGLK